MLSQNSSNEQPYMHSISNSNSLFFGICLFSSGIFSKKIVKNMKNGKTHTDTRVHMAFPLNYPTHF